MHDEKRRRDAFEAEVLAELQTVHAVASHFVGPGASAEDLTQETYARAFAAWDRYSPGTSAKAWLLSILRSQFLRRQRDAGRHPTVELDDELPAHEAEAEPDWAKVTPQVLDAALAELPLKYREVITLRDLQGLSYRDVGFVLELAAGTVMSRLHRARHALRAVLLERMQAPQVQAKARWGARR
jgi:RNA polymerase sigma-70 factor (ECF subfamily)